MSKNNPVDIPKSISHKLLNYSKSIQSDYNLILTRYGLERFLFRLGISEYAKSFLLKGASLFIVWQGQGFRSTRDIDLLGLGAPDIDKIKEIFLKIINQKCVEDGIVFDSSSLKVSVIRKDQLYGGLRVTVVAFLGNARIPVQVDIGYGDIVFPNPEEILFPPILDIPAPKLKAYSKYTVMAEKTEATISLGVANSRMKDIYDICVLCRSFEFDGELLCQTIKRTFKNRKTTIPQTIPISFTETFYNDTSKKIQWNAFIRKLRLSEADTLEVAVNEISTFLMPLFEHIVTNKPFQKFWNPVNRTFESLGPPEEEVTSDT